MTCCALALPTRRVEEWKYSDLARALGDAGFGEETARAVAGQVPAGVEIFALDEPNPPDLGEGALRQAATRMR